MKGVASMVVEAIKRYPLLVIFMLVLLLVMIFAIVYYRMSKKYEKNDVSRSGLVAHSSNGMR